MTSTGYTPAASTNSRPGKRFAQRMFRVDPNDTLPVTLHHERIYILPSKRGLAFFGVVAVMLIASMNYGLNMGYALSFILIGLFASCLLSTYTNIAKLQMATVSATDAFVGEAMEFDLTLREKNQRYRRSITVADSSGAKDTIDLQPGASAVATLQRNDGKRGVHTLGRVTISSDFPLGLWRGWGYIHTRATTCVYPRPETPGCVFVEQLQSDAGPIANQTNEREFKELKPYQKTDSPGSVAWKTVARGAGWFTKDFESHSTTEDLVLRWQDTPSTLDIEQRLSRLSRWILDAEKLTTDYALELPTRFVAASQGLEHKKKCLRQLAVFNVHD